MIVGLPTAVYYLFLACNADNKCDPLDLDMKIDTAKLFSWEATLVRMDKGRRNHTV